ncbi:hypothetical protein CR513_17882, partial [Mucuna pruriens]
MTDDVSYDGDVYLQKDKLGYITVDIPQPTSIDTQFFDGGRLRMSL